jgi:hypothetical protein
MKRAAIRYAEILEAGAWVTHQEQDEIAKLLRSLVMNDDAEDRAWGELEARLNRQKAIKQPEQEPVAWLSNPNFIEQETVEGKPRRVWFECNAGVGIPFYTAPPRKPWVSLTDEEIAQSVGSPIDEVYLNDFRKVEAKLKEKNNE